MEAQNNFSDEKIVKISMRDQFEFLGVFTKEFEQLWENLRGKPIENKFSESDLKLSSTDLFKKIQDTSKRKAFIEKMDAAIAIVQGYINSTSYKITLTTNIGPQPEDIKNAGYLLASLKELKTKKAPVLELEDKVRKALIQFQNKTEGSYGKALDEIWEKFKRINIEEVLAVPSLHQS